MSVNIANLELAIAKKMVSAISTEDALIYAKAIEQLKNGTVNVVDDITSLPSLTVAVVGELYFVKADKQVYFSDGSFWRRIGDPSTNWALVWGNNTQGRLGTNTPITASYAPINIATKYTGWTKISGGNDFTVATHKSGSLWAWGANHSGQLGDGSVVIRSSPVAITGGVSDWRQATTGSGSRHVLAIRANGSLWGWGRNDYGQLGDGTAASKSSPVSVVGGFTDWCQVSTGLYHALGVRTNGTLWAWGRNYCGILGDNTTVSKSSPVSVVGGFNDWCQVSAGWGHTSAVRTNGTLWAWGRNDYGRLGTNSITHRSSPVSVVGGFTDWCQVSSSCNMTIAVRTNGTAWAWGANVNGILGDGTTVSKSSPVSVVGGFTDWCRVETGRAHTIALRTNGTAWSWGCNSNGQLGDNSLIHKSSPVSVAGGFTNWVDVSGGCVHSAGIVNKVI